MKAESQIDVQAAARFFLHLNSIVMRMWNWINVFQPYVCLGKNGWTILARIRWFRLCRTNVSNVTLMFDDVHSCVLFTCSYDEITWTLRILLLNRHKISNTDICIYNAIYMCMVMKYSFFVPTAWSRKWGLVKSVIQKRVVIMW